MSFIYHSKLFKQLIVVMCLLIILAISIPGAISLFYITPNVVEERYHQVMINDADFLASRLDWILTKSLNDIEYLSQKISLSDSAKLQEAGEDLDIFVRSSAIFTGGIITDQEGIMRIFYSSPQGLIELKQKNDVSNRDYIYYPMAKNQTFLSNVIITESNPSPVIFVSDAVEEDGQTTGVLALSINLLNENNMFHSVFQGFQEKKQGNIYVVDGAGIIVYHVDKEKVGNIANSFVLSHVTEKKEGISDDIDNEEENFAVAFSRLKNNDWVVIYEMSHSQIYAMNKASQFSSVVTMGLLLMLGLFASAVFARIILRPLEEITIATEKVAAGDLTQQIDYKGHQDFKRLITNFNTMTANLSSHNEELEKLSLQDYLTGLANRRYFEQQLKMEMDRAYRMGHVSTIILLDIDDFKSINDKFGHLTGDKALKILASELKDMVREVDLPARFGGEEFLVLLPETTLEQGKTVAEKIRDRISKICISNRKGDIAFTVSIGVASTEQGASHEKYSLIEACDSLLKHADKALYTAKNKGKNRIEIHS